MEYTDEYSFSRPYITAGEYVLWKGKPGPGRIVTAADAIMIPFSLIWCGFALFWEYTAITGGAPFFFAIFGLPFVCVGLYLVIGRFFWTAYIRKRTAYGITNKKIIRKRGKKIDMMGGMGMPAVQIKAHSDGSGFIIIGNTAGYRRNGTYINGQPTYAFVLENIPDVAQAQQAIFNMEH